MKAWSLVYEGFDPSQERLREALCTLGNGYFASRGAAPESVADDIHYPGTYLAGCYDRLTTHLAGREVESESLVNIPNLLALSFRIEGGDWLDVARVELLSYRQELDLRRGLLVRHFVFRDAEGRCTRVDERRLVSMDDPHLAALETQVTPEGWNGSIELRTGLDGSVTNSGVARYADFDGHHLASLAAGSDGPDAFSLLSETRQSRVRIAQSARVRLWIAGERQSVPPAVERDGDRVAHRYLLEARDGQPLRIEKVASIHCSRDPACSEPLLEARKSSARAGDFAVLAAGHEARWRQLWERFDVEIEQDDREEEEETQGILRLHLLHLLQTTSPWTSGLDAGMPARGLHGEAYRGHVFWDELFAFPLLNLRMPDITRGLLMYRYRRLGEARRAAREAGFSGAMFPWQSGSNGREETAPIRLNPRSGRWLEDHSALQRHVNAAIPYNVWQYLQVTQDVAFLAHHGAELVFECARFWASAATFSDSRGRFEIRGVVGPDEYHDAYPGQDVAGLDNNAYTNVMAAWVLVRALELRERLPTRRFEELCQLLGLTSGEFDLWDEVSRKMFVPFHGDGIISQFEGYDDLQELDWAGYRERYGDIQRLDRILEAEGDTPNRYKASKQADVLMLFYLLSAEELGALFHRLGYTLEHDTIPRNVDYYMRRTSHGSTLSRVVHAWVLSRADRPGALPLFEQALRSDVSDIQGGTTGEGIHAGAMAGTVDLLQRCFTGMEVRDDALWLNPQLPEGVLGLRQKISYRRQEVGLHVTRSAVRIDSSEVREAAIRLRIRDEVHELGPGEVREFRLPP